MHTNSSHFNQTRNEIGSTSSAEFEDADFKTLSSGKIQSFDPILSSNVKDLKSQIEFTLIKLGSQMNCTVSF